MSKWIGCIRAARATGGRLDEIASLARFLYLAPETDLKKVRTMQGRIDKLLRKA